MESHYRYEKFGKQHKPLRASFSCREEDLEVYLKKQARQDMDSNLATVYLLLDVEDEEHKRIAGYYTISSIGIELPEAMKKGLPRYSQYPATLIGRLALDDDYQGLGLGHELLYDALARALELSEELASFAVVTDAINESAKNFYLHHDFKPLTSSNDERRLVLQMATIKQLFG